MRGLLAERERERGLHTGMMDSSEKYARAGS